MAVLLTMRLCDMVLKKPGQDLAILLSSPKSGFHHVGPWEEEKQEQLTWLMRAPLSSVLELEESGLQGTSLSALLLCAKLEISY